MIMADVLKILLLVIGGLTVLVTYMLAAHALTPRLVERSAQAPGSWRGIIASFAVGIPAAGIALFVALALQSLGHVVATALALLVGTVPLALAFAGSAGVALRIGRGLPSAADRDAPWRTLLRGAIVLVLSFLLPFFGWFVTFPATLAFGLGAALLAVRPKRTAPEVAMPGEAPWGRAA
ncbi:MAG: hypothetical protein MPN21_03175 [Thermoanaerobaculia bacterium]|nr:hypothetical protein [Thermoanaerobaculia bacterium]